MKSSRINVNNFLWLPTVAAAGLIVGASADQADAGHRHRRMRLNVGRAWVPPIYKTIARTVVVPAVFETRARKDWHEPVYETRRVLVDEPAQYVTRRVPKYTRSGRPNGFESVRELIRSERRVWKDQRIVVREGYYETVYDRVLVQPETTRVVYDKVLVRAGHWTSGRHFVRPHRHHGHRHTRTVGFGAHHGGLGFSFELGR